MQSKARFPPLELSAGTIGTFGGTQWLQGPGSTLISRDVILAPQKVPARGVVLPKITVTLGVCSYEHFCVLVYFISAAIALKLKVPGVTDVSIILSTWFISLRVAQRYSIHHQRRQIEAGNPDIWGAEIIKFWLFLPETKTSISLSDSLVMDFLLIRQIEQSQLTRNALELDENMS